jgi:NAD(P)H dehydrogenase (quinone)
MVIQGSSAGDHYGPVAIGDLDERSRQQCLAYGERLAKLTLKLHP